MRRVLLLTAMLLAIGAAPASAGDAVTCSFSVHLAFSGGSFIADEPGSSVCSGVMGGLPVVGEGGLGLTGTLRSGELTRGTGLDCLDGTAAMRVSTRLRDAVGIDVRRWRRVTGAITLTRLGPVWVGGGEMHGGRSAMSLVAAFAPDAVQDCRDGTLSGGTLHGRLLVRR